MEDHKLKVYCKKCGNLILLDDNSKEPLDVNITLRFTRTQQQRLMATAKFLGVSLTDLIRIQALKTIYSNERGSK